jgi:AcrR family transcriptional regulator
MNKTRGRGRPRGTTNTQADILAAARRRFLAEGYDAVTLRAIALDAGVDVALISYYFGSKKGVFGAAMALGAANPALLLAGELHGPLNSLPERLVRTVLRVWDDPRSGPTLRAFLDAVVREPHVARSFAEMMELEMLPSIAARLGDDADATRRAALVTSQIAGLILSRYVLRVEPVATMSQEELARRMAPGLRAALTPPVRPRSAASRAGRRA